MKKSLYTYTSSIVALALLTGCASSGQPKIENKTINENDLYVSFNVNSKKIDKITNNEKIKGFTLNNYNPLGFDTKEKIETFPSGLLWNKGNFEDTKTYYQNVECYGGNIAGDIIFNTMGALVLPFLTGGVCSKIKYFEYKRFDDDVKKIINPKDRIRLLSKYDQLKNLSKINESKINSLVNEKNSLLTEQYSKYSKQYKEYMPLITYKIIDNSGLYQKEKLKNNINIQHNHLTQESSIRRINYQSNENSVFPCNSVNNCVKNINNSMLRIEEIKDKDNQKIIQEASEKLKRSKEYLTEKASFVNVINDINQSQLFETNKIEKILYYKVKVPSKVSVLDKRFDAQIIINHVDYKNIFPNYSNKNKDLKIQFNGPKKNYNLQNLTDDFIQIKSVSLYYNGSITDLTFNENNNIFSKELSPKENLYLSLYENINDSTYLNLTKDKAKKLNGKFGFAIKYTKGNQTKNITLYKQIKFSVFDIIKDI